jgi:hypothetical protein
MWERPITTSLPNLRPTIGILFPEAGIGGVYMDRCPNCNQIVRIADWPFCPHGNAYGRDAQVAAPTVVFRNKKGEWRAPGRDTDKPPRGFVRVELKTQRQKDAFEKEIGAIETAKLRAIEYSKHEAYKATVAAHRDNLLRIKANSQSEYTKRFVDVCLADAEKRIAAGGSVRAESGFHIESNHYDATNRPPWEDKDTNWKPKK